MSFSSIWLEVAKGYDSIIQKRQKLFSHDMSSFLRHTAVRFICVEMRFWDEETRILCQIIYQDSES